MPDFGMTRALARQMVDEDRWDELCRQFNFKPAFTLYRGKTYFNWVSAPASLMSALGWTGAPPPHVVKKYKYKFDEPTPDSIVPPPAKPLGVPNDNGPTKRLVHKLFKKQNGCCYYCGLPTEAKQRTKDHKIPRCRGGRHHDNYVGACKTCNVAKGSMTVEEFLDTDYLPNTRRAQLGREDPPKIKFTDAQNLHGERLMKKIGPGLPVHYRTTWPEGCKTNVW